MKEFIFKYRYIFFPLFAIIALIAFGGAIMYLWNWLIPDIFGLTTINFWQAAGLFILSRILFSGMGHKGRHGHGGKWGSRAGREKWMNMTPEERREWFKKRKFGHWQSRMDECFTDSDTKEKDGPDSE